MSNIQTQWDNPQHTVILMSIMHKWTWTELRESVLVCNSMIESVPHHVHFICNLGAAPWTPGNLLVNLKETVKLFTPNDGYRMVVTHNGILSEIVHVASAMSGGLGFRYGFCRSVDEARQFLSKQPNLPRK